MSRAGRRLSRRDRGWLGTDLYRVVGPLAGPDPAALGAALRAAHAGAPGAPLLCRLDRTGYRWVPLDPAGFAARLPALVLCTGVPYTGPESTGPASTAPAGAGPGTGAGPAGARALLAFLRRQEPGDRPLLLAVHGPWVALRATHAAGDAATVDAWFARLLHDALAGGGTGPYRRPGRLVLARALARHFGTAPATVLPALRVRRPPVPAPGTGPAGVPAPVHLHARTGAGALDALRRHRDRYAPGVSVVAALAAALYRALDRGAGTPLAPGLVVLVNTRRYLSAASTVDGNFAWGQYLEPGDPGDPGAVDAALRAELAGGRPLAMLALRDARALLPAWPPRARARPAPGTGGTGPLVLTVTHYGRLDGYRGLPWRVPAPDRCFLAAPAPAGPTGITVALAELDGVLHLSAGCHPGTVAPGRVRHALELVAADPVAGWPVPSRAAATPGR